MIIHVGSINDVKVYAVKEVIQPYQQFNGAIVHGKNVPSGVSEQPTSLDEIAQGAKNRAVQCFDGSKFSFGIEDGVVLLSSNGSKKYGIVSACVLYDGNNVYIGNAEPFMIPTIVAEKVLYEHMDLNKAMYTLGFTNDPSIGRSIGAVGVLSSGILQRKEHIKQGITKAILQL